MTPEVGRPGIAGIQPSFRDPDGSLVEFDGRVLRLVRERAVGRVTAFLRSPLARALITEGLVVGTWIPEDADGLVRALHGALQGQVDPPGLLLEHDRLPFPSYPHEWPAEMLWEAGRLTVELCERGLAEGFRLKDATPYNVLFRGPRPVFVDVLSFEPRDPGEFVWAAYGQFVRTFLLPLALWRFARVPPTVVFASYREGLTPEQAARWLGPVARFLPPVLTLATLPAWLARGAERMGDRLHRRRTTDPEAARYVLQRLFRGLRRQLERLRPPVDAESEWRGYEESADPSALQARNTKYQWVLGNLRRLAPRAVLDVGCNTGVFAEAAAEAGARVVAVDRDPVVVGLTWRRASQAHRDVLPLVVDLARPTPALGWKNLECRSFLDRARGAFDGVLMLALLHHLAVTDRVPVEEVAALAWELSPRFVVVEFVPREDPMFRRLVRGREALFEDWTRERFERAFQRWFDVVDTVELQGSGRRLYCMVRRV